MTFFDDFRIFYEPTMACPKVELKESSANRPLFHAFLSRRPWRYHPLGSTMKQLIPHVTMPTMILRGRRAFTMRSIIATSAFRPRDSSLVSLRLTPIPRISSSVRKFGWSSLRKSFPSANKASFHAISFLARAIKTPVSRSLALCFCST